MKVRKWLIASLALAALLATARVQAFDETHYGHGARWRAALRPWHGRYYNVQYGQPLALVVPPTAENQVHWGWGVGATRITPNQHQFQRDYPGPGMYNRSWFRPTPPWPSSTDQFGDYYIRGPW